MGGWGLLVNEFSELFGGLYQVREISQLCGSFCAEYDISEPLRSGEKVAELFRVSPPELF